jgi:hypothetical protein
MAEVQLFTNPLYNKQPSLVHLEVQATSSAYRGKLAVHVCFD